MYIYVTVVAVEYIPPADIVLSLISRDIKCNAIRGIYCNFKYVDI